MKKTLVIFLALAFVLSMSAIALAYDSTVNAPGTFTEVSPEAGSNIPTSASVAAQTKYGASAWVYKDKMDGSFKFEGSYREFHESTATGTTDQGGYGAGYYDFAAGNDSGPHDGYDTGSNKCKTCHAVHRATGAYRLMRVDNPEDVCSYCHVGDHKHSMRGAYYRSGANMVYTTNGHTMGAGQTIPDSSVNMWLTAKSMEVVGSDGVTVTVSYNVREYSSDRNKLFYWTSYRSSYHANGWQRIGPTYLSCLSCHQPHNADELVWKPGTLTNGYKLLRSAPSGSSLSVARMAAYGATNMAYGAVKVDTDGTGTTLTLGAAHGTALPNVFAGDELHVAGVDSLDNAVEFTAVIESAVTSGTNKVCTVTDIKDHLGNPLATVPAMLAANSHWGLGDENIMRVPEGTVTQNTTGNGGASDRLENEDGVTWTTWKGSNFAALDTTGGYNVPKLSLWCADCHNLNIGHYETISGASATALRSSGLHSDRTHTSSGSRMECWNCHSSNMPVTDADAAVYSGGVSMGAGCTKCHYYSNGAEFYKTVRWDNPATDFPHSGSQTGFKLLTEETTNTAPVDAAQGNINYGVNSISQSIDGFCLRCHNLINSQM